MDAKYARLIDGETQLMGVLGEHIAYTRSPWMHNRAANLLGLNIAYLPLPLPADQVGSFLQAAWHLGAVGFNVTTPHKGLVASLIPGTPLRSVNTLFRGADGWEAASTDGEGFARGLERLGRSLASFAEIVIVGGGGATLAILAHVARVARPLPRVLVLRRSAARDAELTAALPPGAPLATAELTQTALVKALKGRGDDCLLIQATSAPQRGDDLAELVLALDGYGGVVCDIVYGKPSALYFAALARDLLVQDGEAMLIEQARLAQRLWWGRAASYEDMALALRGK